MSEEKQVGNDVAPVTGPVQVIEIKPVGNELVSAVFYYEAVWRMAIDPAILWYRVIKAETRVCSMGAECEHFVEGARPHVHLERSVDTDFLPNYVVAAGIAGQKTLEGSRAKS